MDILGYLRGKYPHQANNIKYLPRWNCNRCGGNGEQRLRDGSLYVCPCTCIESWDNELSKAVSDAAKKAIAELDDERSNHD